MGGKQKVKEKDRQRFFGQLGRQQSFLSRVYGLPHPASWGERREGQRRNSPLDRKRKVALLFLRVGLGFVVVFIVAGAILQITRLITELF